MFELMFLGLGVGFMLASKLLDSADPTYESTPHSDHIDFINSSIAGWVFILGLVISIASAAAIII